MGLPCGTYPANCSDNMAVIRTRFQWVMWIGFLILLALLPFFLSGRIIGLLNNMGVTIIIVMGLGILMGYGGQINIGQAAFVCVGAYTCMILANAGFQWYITIPAAAVVTAMIGTFFGLAALRIKGFYLALATLAAQMTIPIISDLILRYS